MREREGGRVWLLCVNELSGKVEVWDTSAADWDPTPGARIPVKHATSQTPHLDGHDRVVHLFEGEAVDFLEQLMAYDEHGELWNIFARFLEQFAAGVCKAQTMRRLH
jgi:hypothetical protein